MFIRYAGVRQAYSLIDGCIVFICVSLEFRRLISCDRSFSQDLLMSMGMIFYLCAAGGISSSFLAFLHAFDYDGVDRNHPRSIKRRFIAAMISNAVSITFTYIVIRKHSSSPLQSMGIHLRGLPLTVLCPALLTNVVYLGNWIIHYIDGDLRSATDLSVWKTNFQSLAWIRDSFMVFVSFFLYLLCENVDTETFLEVEDRFLAPITEELAFRACGVTLILQCMSPDKAVFVAPLPFALGHLHHIFDDMRKSMTLQDAIFSRGFQVSYTYLFGTYASFLFVRTGTVIAPIVAHSICNNMGLPMLSYIGNYSSKLTRIFVWTSFVTGFVLSIILLMPLTDRRFYESSL